MAVSVGALKGSVVRTAGSATAAIRRRTVPNAYRPGVTVVTVTWNSLPFLRSMLAATRAMSDEGTEILVIDNASSDGTLEFLRTQDDVRVMRLPTNLGHGVALDLAVPTIDTEFLAVLDVDAFPVSAQWLPASLRPLEGTAKVAGAHVHRNYVHPCFLVTSTAVVHQYGLTFRPVGSLKRLATSAPLFLDVGEALSQRLIVKFGGGQALHFFEVTSVRGPGTTGAVFGDLVYHNQYATQGEHRESARQVFEAAFTEHHPALALR